MRKIKEYLQNKKTLAPDLRRAEFAKAARSFGKADPKTQAFRDECSACGFSVVFRSGLSREDTLAVLKSPETTDILGSL